jgi:DNA-binding GntR family transcriptional regulator
MIKGGDTIFNEVKKKYITLSELAFDRILDKITKGEFKVGQVFTDERLVTELKMSKTPIREALKALEHQGLLAKVGKSYGVVNLTKEDILHIYEFKQECEPLAAYLCATRVENKLIIEMKNVLRNIERLDHNKDIVYLANLNGRLHKLISVGSGNTYLEETIDLLRFKLMIVRVNFYLDQKRSQEELNEHKMIVHAIARRDAESARELMAQHQFNIRKYAEEYIIPRICYI